MMRRRVLIPAIALVLGCGREPDEREILGTPVTTEVVRRGLFAATMTLSGVVTPSRLTPVIATAGGTVSYPARFAGGLRTGERVVRGETLATISNETARLALAEARLQLETASAELERMERSFAEGLIAATEVSAARLRVRLARERWQSARTNAGRLTLTAPVSGTLIVSRQHTPGSEIEAGTRLAEIGDVSELLIETVVPAAALARVQPRTEFDIHVAGSARPVGRGTLREVSAVLDQNGTGRAVGVVTEGERALTSGMMVELRLHAGRRTDVITVDERAVVPTESGHSVFVVSAGGQQRARVRSAPVTLGPRGGGRVEVVDGLREGDRVVVSGVEALADGTVVVEVPQDDAV